jgi:hypothetical protein
MSISLLEAVLVTNAHSWQVALKHAMLPSCRKAKSSRKPSMNIDEADATAADGAGILGGDGGGGETALGGSFFDSPSTNGESRSVIAGAEIEGGDGGGDRRSALALGGEEGVPFRYVAAASSSMNDRDVAENSSFRRQTN